MKNTHFIRIVDIIHVLLNMKIDVKYDESKWNCAIIPNDINSSAIIPQFVSQESQETIWADNFHYSGNYLSQKYLGMEQSEDVGVSDGIYYRNNALNIFANIFMPHLCDIFF